ncbi:MAG: hypothetical protein ABL973_09735 [Micropepsaceae bacterium]
MKNFKYGLLAASALCASGLVAFVLPATARDRSDVSVSITLGNAAFGYSDGYYDQSRGWHDWRDEDERSWYRTNHGPTYFDMNRSQDRDQYRGDWREGRRSDWRNDRGRADFSIVLNNVAFGYSDGYYDQNRGWHDWRDNDERDWYRSNRGPSYYEMRREQDRDQYRSDWRDGRRSNWRNDRSRADFSIVLSNVAFGYSDGYYDQNRGWHDWRDNDERDWYRSNRGPSYYEMRREQDRDQYRGDWRDGRRSHWRNDRGGVDFSIILGGVVFGYSDGYYDQYRRWHTWRSNDERRWYQQNRRQSYYNMRHNRDRHRGRIDWREGRRQDWRDSRDRN